MSKKWLISSIILITAVSVTAFYFFTGNTSEDIAFRFDKVTRGDLQVVVTATGTLSAVTTVQVGSQVSGILSRINADFNDKVKRNQVIAQIDPTFLEASVRDAEANLQRSKAQLNKSQRNFERVKTLIDKNLASQADYDVALADFESATASDKQSEAQLERAKINLRYATIKSPIDGVVISRAVDVGQTVAASLSAPTLFTIANDLTKMQVQASVDEADIGKVIEGQEVTFTVDAYPEQTFKGSVRQVRLSPKVEQNVVNYTVIIDVPNKELKLMPGMTATVTIQVEKRQDVLKVPTIALRFNPPEELIETRRDSTQNGDSSRNDRRRQFMERMQQGGGGFSPDMAARRMSQRSFSRIWVLNKNKKLEPVFIRPGISDGTYTEVLRGRVQEEQEIVIGTLSQKNNSVNNNPFGQQQRSTGMPRRF